MLCFTCGLQLTMDVNRSLIGCKSKMVPMQQLQKPESVMIIKIEMSLPDLLEIVQHW